MGEKLKMKKDRLRISETEWFAMFMMIQTKKRKGVEGHQIQSLKDIVKKGGEEVIEQFREKFKEMRIESNRGKVSEAYYMGHGEPFCVRYSKPIFLRFKFFHCQQ